MLPKRLTLCQDLVKSDNYQDNVDFFVGNAMTSLNNLKHSGELKNSAEVYASIYVSADIRYHMELAAPKYTTSQNEDGAYVVRKFFELTSHYKDIPPVEYYQAYKQAVIDNNFASVDYFKNYEQTNLEGLQNFLARNNATFVQEEGDFCRLLVGSEFKDAECVVGECIRYDSVTANGHLELCN